MTGLCQNWYMNIIAVVLTAFCKSGEICSINLLLRYSEEGELIALKVTVMVFIISTYVSGKRKTVIVKYIINK
jgi:hypothetical protein